MTDRFSEDRGKYHIHTIGEEDLELVGGGDFYDLKTDDCHPDEETMAEAHKLAEKYGKVITDSWGRWEGYSEYTPDPGDISCFYWKDAV